MNNEEVILKIKKLLALSYGNPSKEEGFSAREKAEELMNLHGLSLKDIERGKFPEKPKPQNPVTQPTNVQSEQEKAEKRREYELQLKEASKNYFNSLRRSYMLLEKENPTWSLKDMLNRNVFPVKEHTLEEFLKELKEGKRKL